MRKSPIKHHVRQHKRKGRPVHDYDRGHGKRISKPTLQCTKQTQSTGRYGVIIRYESLPAESFPVTASSFDEAIELAMNARTHITPPYAVEVAKN